MLELQTCFDKAETCQVLGMVCNALDERLYSLGSDKRRMEREGLNIGQHNRVSQCHQRGEMGSLSSKLDDNVGGGWVALKAIVDPLI